MKLLAFNPVKKVALSGISLGLFMHLKTTPVG